jgi:hypothetical protein
VKYLNVTPEIINKDSDFATLCNLLKHSDVFNMKYKRMFLDMEIKSYK